MKIILIKKNCKLNSKKNKYNFLNFKFFLNFIDWFVKKGKNKLIEIELKFVENKK